MIAKQHDAMEEAGCRQLSRSRATCGPTSVALQAKLTAGVSYVVHTESRQQGADGLPCLPHLGERGRSGAGPKNPD